MKLKLKQSNSVSKHFELPPILNFHPNRYTPRLIDKNNSLPKISPSILEGKHLPPYKTKVKTQNDDRRTLKSKIKSINQKKKPYLVHNQPMQKDQTTIQYQQANITSNFKREVQKNLQMIKKQKEQHKKIAKIEKTRYNTPRNATLQPRQASNNYIRPNKCYTQEDQVFAKLNQIIINSQSKSIQVLQQSRSISYSAYATNKRKKINNENSQSMIELQKQILESEESNKNSRSISQVNRIKEIEIKNEGNYHQWRKLSIDSDNSKKINYHMSSFEMETDRLQKIRSKNQLSLKKYIQGKNYLRKLANFRDYSLLMPSKDRY